MPSIDDVQETSSRAASGGCTHSQHFFRQGAVIFRAVRCGRIFQNRLAEAGSLGQADVAADAGLERLRLGPDAIGRALFLEILGNVDARNINEQTVSQAYLKIKGLAWSNLTKRKAWRIFRRLVKYRIASPRAS